MPLAPYKDRSIKLTLEGEYLAQASTPFVKAFAKSVVDNFLPNPGLITLAGRLLNSENLEDFSRKREISRSKVGTILLKGPTSFNADFSADVADEQGLQNSFLQPWYIKNIPIEIRGESYLGMYDLLSVSDRDAKDVLNMFTTSLRAFSSQFGVPGTKERVVLEISNNPLGAERFIGFIRGFKIGEDVRKGYILDYDLRYIGIPMQGLSMANGKADAQNADRLFSGVPIGR